MRNPLQDQLLKAGLVKKAQVAQVVREQTRQQHSKTPAAPTDEQKQVERLRVERVERDRALAAERNAQARAGEVRAQARQIVHDQRIPARGEIEYRFVDGNSVRALQVDPALRTQLANGALVIARLDDGYALLPRAAVAKVQARDASMIVVDHASGAAVAPVSDEDAWYARFEVPDDLVW